MKIWMKTNLNQITWLYKTIKNVTGTKVPNNTARYAENVTSFDNDIVETRACVNLIRNQLQTNNKFKLYIHYLKQKLGRQVRKDLKLLILSYYQTSYSFLLILIQYLVQLSVNTTWIQIGYFIHFIYLTIEKLK